MGTHQEYWTRWSIRNRIGWTLELNRVHEARDKVPNKAVYMIWEGVLEIGTITPMYRPTPL